MFHCEVIEEVHVQRALFCLNFFKGIKWHTDTAGQNDMHGFVCRLFISLSDRRSMYCNALTGWIDHR